MSIFDPPPLKINRRIRWSDTLGIVRSLSKGEKVVIEGEIDYGQDFCFWRGDFPPDLIWTVESVWEDGRVSLKSYGNGVISEPYDPKSYGCGGIHVSAKSAKQIRRAP